MHSWINCPTYSPKQYTNALVQHFAILYCCFALNVRVPFIFYAVPVSLYRSIPRYSDPCLGEALQYTCTATKCPFYWVVYWYNGDMRRGEFSVLACQKGFTEVKGFRVDAVINGNLVNSTLTFSTVTSDYNKHTVMCSAAVNNKAQETTIVRGLCTL